jgi:hypothetical protein
MMMLHQKRHERQANHATNHARCRKTSKGTPTSRRHIEAKQSKTTQLSDVWYGTMYHTILVWKDEGARYKVDRYGTLMLNTPVPVTK